MIQEREKWSTGLIMDNCTSVWTISYNDLTLIDTQRHSKITLCVKGHMFHFTAGGNNLNRKILTPK